MTTSDRCRTPLMLHACCGPCSLMPTKLLRAAGFEPIIFYCNPNIAPTAEYERRFDTLKQWADQTDVVVEEGPLAHEAWVERVAKPYEARLETSMDREEARQERCRACYRIRFEATAKRARALGIPYVSTTLSVSPYQYTAIIEEELQRAATDGLKAHFEDFRPVYPEATREAKALGLYRQNYCGCELSFAEAAEERQARKEKRAQAQALKREAQRPQREAEQRAREARIRERKAYDAKRARQKALLRSLRGFDEK